jgi:hypothetical protein
MVFRPSDSHSAHAWRRGLDDELAALSTAAPVYARSFAMHGRHTLARRSGLVGALVPAGIAAFGRA